MASYLPLYIGAILYCAMDENDFKKKVARLHPHVFMQWIESGSTAEGIADAWLICNGWSAWAEFKYLQAWPKRNNTIVRIEHYTMNQRLFLKSVMDNGGNSILVVGVANKILYYHGTDCLSIGYLTKQEMLERDVGWLVKK